VASHTISGQRWPDGTSVGVYLATAWPEPAQLPGGTAIATASVSGGAVSFSGLAPKVRYVAYASGLGVRFLVPEHSPTDSISSRVTELEGEAALGLEGLSNALDFVSGAGLIDEFTDLQSFLTGAAGGIAFFPAAIYKWTGSLTVPDDTTVWCAPGAEFVPQSNQSAVVFSRGGPTSRTPDGTQYQLTVDSVVGALSVTVSAADAAHFAVGARVALRDATYTNGGVAVKRETNIVTSVDTVGGVIGLERPVAHVYTAANDSWIANVTMARNVTWIGGTADLTAVAGGLANDSDFIEANWPENCLVTGLTVTAWPGKGVSFYGGLDSRIEDVNGYAPSRVAAGEGYVTQLTYCRDSFIRRGWSRNVRHHADITGGAGCWIEGGHTVGRTSDDQVGAFLHGLESRWCGVRGFSGGNVDTIAAAGNGTFTGDFDFTLEDVACSECGDGSHQVMYAYKSTGRIIRPWVRNPQGMAINVTNTGADVEVLEPDVDMGTLSAAAIGTTGLLSGNSYRVKGGVLRHNDAASSPVTLSAPVGCEVLIDGVEFRGTMLRAVSLTGASTDQVVRNPRIRGTVGEQIRADAGELLVDGGDFAPSGSSVAVRAALTCARLTIAGRPLWGGATTRISNTASAILVGTSTLETQGTAAPTTGTWSVGDRCWKTDVAAAGIPGWVCTTAGTPGTWKAMAAVAA
jgi:hypothetical protein